MKKIKMEKNLIILFFICLTSNLLSNIALETDEIPQTNRVSKLHCPKKGRCYWTEESIPSELSLNVKANVADLLAGVIASFLLVIGEDNGIPYGHFPWLFLSFKSLILIQGPSIAKFGHVALPVKKYSTIAFMIISTFMYAMEWSLWLDMINSCRILWIARKKELVKKAAQDRKTVMPKTQTDEKNSRLEQFECRL